MSICPYIVEVIVPTDLRGCRPDYKRPFVPTEASAEDPPTSCREMISAHFPWLKPGTCGIREFHLSEFFFAKDETRLTVLLLGNDTVPERIPVDGERVVLRRPTGEVFHSDVHVSYYVGAHGIEPIEGDVAQHIIASGDTLEIGSNLREFLWFPLTERLEEFIQLLKGDAWFQAHADEVYSAESAELHDADLASMMDTELEVLAAKIVEDIEYAETRSIREGTHLV